MLLNFDKLIHLIEYFILGILLMKSMKSISAKMLILVIPFGIFFGIMDEYLQSFISGRFSSIWDVLADTLGIIIGSLLVIGNSKKSKDIFPSITTMPLPPAGANPKSWINCNYWRDGCWKIYFIKCTFLCFRCKIR